MRANSPRPSGTERNAHAIALVRRLAVERRPSKITRPDAAGDQAGNGAHQRALAGAVGADDADDLAVADSDVDAVEREERAIA